MAVEDLGELARALQSGAKGKELQKLSESADAKRVGEMVDGEALRRAAQSGDAAALKKLLGSLLNTPEGKRLAADVQRLMGK